MAMNNPVHPGAIVREDCLKPLGLSVTEGAKRLGIGRQTLSNLVNGRRPSRLKWPTACRRRLAPRPKPGSPCSWLSTSRGRATWNRK